MSAKSIQGVVQFSQGVLTIKLNKAEKLFVYPFLCMVGMQVLIPAFKACRKIDLAAELICNSKITVCLKKRYSSRLPRIFKLF